MNSAAIEYMEHMEGYESKKKEKEGFREEGNAAVTTNRSVR